ncbi:HTH-type transcriptional regulator UlaR [Mannheimia haemolytica]|uniref:HTH-type transcriptional regulator UlaR n=1 Tax=Mannheimia haemolytica TaxID=75985 RepID=UPI0005C99B9A|nr:HTH-type transcriptional regulator UlaR [Mannheimia haemolytica]KIX29572.1 transcriptional regulator [Mannheimia haemolytica]MCB4227156.1 HTH-type transcriptional regulator UlaR [Mannheimia haemolytica]MDW0616744.1 HTH-type transcriptional regulator UlaR [Mannheimia haemolytica]MEE3731357.1 HTH-type transcriptional regulator UlaR [Mannheimia haemolytica]UQX70035.1 HTH-type transcriptional regulator UlaR [Mannheimia haemolytica]
MNESYRHKELLALLEERKALSTADIMQLLNISPATARRDISKLDGQGKLKKVRNGAEAILAPTVFTAHKITNNAQEKRRIAEAAGRLCKDGESLILTCGSTMEMLGEVLCGRKLQIITNYLPLANQLIAGCHDDVVIMGGQYNKHKKVMLSINTQNEMTYAATTMFTSGKGLTSEGLFKTDMIIANAEQQMAKHAERYVVLLDSTKLGKKVGMLFKEFDKIDLLITGKEADPTIIQELRNRGLDIILA